MMFTISSAKPNQFPVIIRQDESGAYFVSCPLFDGCFSEGDTVDEALKNIKEVITMCLEEALEEGRLPSGVVPKADVQYVSLD